ncbi:MAG: type I methionyl aminopeptidase [Clostridiales bacterium]|nr:type I methionyl aminopeptidase [Clostridiales bacterium]
MIQLKNREQLELMRQAGRITGEALLKAGEAVHEGVTTRKLDGIIRAYIESCGAIPSFLGYGGFPSSACISVNDEVIHGIPSDRVLQEGDIVKIDVGACYRGYHGDSARTFPVGRVSAEAKRLITATRDSFYKAIEKAVPGNRLGDIGHAVESHVTEFGYSVVRQYVGHGIGRSLHEQPDVPNYGKPGHGPRLMRGMVLAVEPMVNVGAPEVRVLQNGWTVVTVDGSLSAHFEHTVAITEDGPVLLTDVE